MTLTYIGRIGSLGYFRHVGHRSTWTPKVCKRMAFMAVIMGLRLLFYILSGLRYILHRISDPPPEAQGCPFLGPLKGHLRILLILKIPSGSKDPNNRVLGPKYHECYSLWALKPYFFFPWTLRICALPNDRWSIVYFRTITYHNLLRP